MSFISQLGDWLRKVHQSFFDVSINGKDITLTRHNGNTVVITTQDTDTTYDPATQRADGLMSSADKVKLDGISTGAEVNQNAFSNVKVGSTTVAANAKTDTLELVAGNNVTLTPDATNDKIIISATDSVYTHPTTAGNKHIPSGGSNGQILRWSSDGTAAWGADNNTTYPAFSTARYVNADGYVDAFVFNDNDAQSNRCASIRVFNDNGYHEILLGVHNESNGAATGLSVRNTNGTITAKLPGTLTVNAIKIGTGNIGSETKPVYVNAGVITAGTYELNKTVPSNAVFTDTVTTVSTSGSGNAVTNITANNGALTVTKGATYVTANDNVASATKLKDARTISLGDKDFVGSASFNGTGNVSLNATAYCAIVTIGNTNNYPYHYIGTTGIQTGNYFDGAITLLVDKGFQGGGYGICRIKARTNNASGGSVGGCEVEWLVRTSALAIDAIQVGFRNTAADSIWDIFYKSAGTYNSVIIRTLGINSRTEIRRNFSLLNSSEVNNTTTSSKGASVGAYASINDAVVDLHPGKTYTSIVTAVDSGVANVANKLGTADIGTATKPIYLDDGTPKACTYPLDVFVKSGSTAAVGLVPKPSTTAGATKYLCENGTWKTPAMSSTVGITLNSTNVNTTNSYTYVNSGQHGFFLSLGSSVKVSIASFGAVEFGTLSNFTLPSGHIRRFAAFVQVSSNNNVIPVYITIEQGNKIFVNNHSNASIAAGWLWGGAFIEVADA